MNNFFDSIFLGMHPEPKPPKEWPPYQVPQQPAARRRAGSASERIPANQPQPYQGRPNPYPQWSDEGEETPIAITPNTRPATPHPTTPNVQPATPLPTTPSVQPARPLATTPNVQPARPIVRPEPKPAKPIVRPEPQPTRPIVRPEPQPAKPIVRPTPQPANPVVRPKPQPAKPIVRPEPQPARPIVRPEPQPVRPIVRPEPQPVRPNVQPEILPARPNARPEIQRDILSVRVFPIAPDMPPAKHRSNTESPCTHRNHSPSSGYDCRSRDSYRSGCSCNAGDSDYSQRPNYMSYSYPGEHANRSGHSSYRRQPDVCPHCHARICSEPNFDCPPGPYPPPYPGRVIG